MEHDQELDDERTELREDEKKLQIALQEYDDEWDFASDDDDDEDEGRFLIDLENEGLETTATEQSVNSGTSSIGSTSHSHGKSILVEDDRSCETREQQGLVSSLPSSSFDGVDLGSSSTSVADPEKTLALNRALQGILEGHIEAIQDAIADNKERQEHLEEDLTNPKKPGKVRTGPFRAPYFRVGTEYPEPNEDVVAKRQFSQMRSNGTLGISKDLRYFQTRSKTTLRKYVLEDCLEKMIRPLMSKMEAEIERCDLAKSREEEQEYQLELERPKLAAITDPKARMDHKFLIVELEEGIREQKAKVKEHSNKIAKLEEEISSKKNYTNEDEVLNAVDSEKIDWMRISKMNYGGNKSWVDCQKAWDHYVNPKVTTGLWTPEEKAKLKELVDGETSNPGSHVDWAQVAQSLGTGRTAFQCLSCYQRNFNTELRSRPWTAEEEKRLIEEANKIYDCVGFFNWRKVSALVDNRSPYECMLRFTQVGPNQNHGKFTPEEDAKLLAAVEMFGLRWREIARFVGTRNAVQVRDRYLVCLNPENNYLVFTYDEDVKLLKYHKELGPVWAQISQHFQGRAPGRIGARFRQLQRWKKKKEWFDNQPLEVKRVLLGKSLPVRERRDLEARIREYFVQQLGINLEDYKRQVIDRSNGVDPDIIPPRPPFLLRLSHVKSSMELHSAARWAKKITAHQTLRDSLQRILKEDAERKARAKSAVKLPKVIEEENEENLVNRAVSETLQEQALTEKAQPQKIMLRKMENLLAKAFHQGSAVHVSKILETLNKPKKEEKQTKFQRKHLAIDAALKKIFYQECRNNYRPGRARKIFEKDMRSEEVIKEEKTDLERRVPTICLKGLGSSLLQIYLSARRKHILMQEQLLNFPNVEDDPEFLVQEARIDQQLEEIALKEAEDGTENTVLREKCEKRKKTLWRIFKEKYLMEHKKLKTAAYSVQEDIINFQRQLKQTGELTKLPPDSLASWLTKGKGEVTKQKQGDESASHSGCDPNSSPSMFAHGKPGANKRPFSNLDSPDIFTTQAKKSKIGAKFERQNDAHQMESSEKQSEEETPGMDSSYCMSEAQSFRFLSQDEIEKEQICIEQMTRSLSAIPTTSSASLPCLPPNVATLTLLKSILLKRGEFLRRASPLTDLAKQENIPLPKADFKIDSKESKKISSVEVDKVRENIVLVDPQGKELKIEEYAEFIEEETVESSTDKSDTEQKDQSVLMASRNQKWTKESKSRTIKEFPSKTAHVRGKAQAKNILISNPEYNVANFLMSEGSSLSNNTAVSSRQEAEGMPDNLHQEQQKNSSYEVVVVPLSNRHPSKIEKPKEEFMPPKSLNRTAKTYANISSQRSSKESQKRKKAESAQANSSGIRSSCEGTRNNQFDFPNLIHTGKELIEIVEDSSNSESDSEHEAESICDTNSEVTEAMNLTLASEERYEGLVRSVQQEQQEQHDSNVIVVDFAKHSGRDNVVHYKKEGKGADSFKAFESKATYAVEERTTSTDGLTKENVAGKVIEYEDTFSVLDQVSVGTSESIRKEQQLWRKIEALRGLRQSQEYKTLRSRMQALFLWPVLMSMVRQVSNPRLRQQIKTAEPQTIVPNGRKKRGRPPKSKAKGRGRPKGMTKAKRLEENMKTERFRRAQFMQQKRQERRELRAAAATASPVTQGGRETDPIGVGIDGNVANVVYSEPVRLEDVTLAFPAANEGKKNEDKRCPDESHVQEGAQATEEQPKIKGRGRRKGVKYDRKVYPPAIERPKRNPPKRQTLNDVTEKPRKPRKAKEKSPPRKTPMEMRETTRAVPQWWKDAVLAAMMAKQTLAQEEGSISDEVPIEEDEDFQDKGQYSDDEWVQDWKNKEKGRESDSLQENTGDRKGCGETRKRHLS